LGTPHCHCQQCTPEANIRESPSAADWPECPSRVDEPFWRHSLRQLFVQGRQRLQKQLPAAMILGPSRRRISLLFVAEAGFAGQTMHLLLEEEGRTSKTWEVVLEAPRAMAVPEQNCPHYAMEKGWSLGGLISYIITAASAVGLPHFSSCGHRGHIPKKARLPLCCRLISVATSRELNTWLVEEVAERSLPRKCVWENFHRQWTSVAYDTSCSELLQAVCCQFQPNSRIAYKPSHRSRLVAWSLAKCQAAASPAAAPRTSFLSLFSTCAYMQVGDSHGSPRN
jgi:hypothetical protein